MSVGTGWGVWFLHLNGFEFNDVLLLRTNNKGNLIFQHPELFVFYSKTTSFPPNIESPWGLQGVQLWEATSNWLSFHAEKNLALGSDISVSKGKLQGLWREVKEGLAPNQTQRNEFGGLRWLPSKF